MKKKKSGGGGANWMDTYGDMVTLLLCFFVLLYSMSTISQEKWEAVVMSFNPNAIDTLTETSGNDGPNADPNTEEGSGMGMTQAEINANMEALYEAIQEYVIENGAEDAISVTKGDGKIFVSFSQVVFFNGDDWTLREESKPILIDIAGMLDGVSSSIEELRISGHTAQRVPGRPNDPTVDRMLSAQRAANVLAYIQQNCSLDPARMVSEGYGQWRPAGDNNTPEGRAKNRRVEMMISGRNLQNELGDEFQQYDTTDK